MRRFKELGDGFHDGRRDRTAGAFQVLAGGVHEIGELDEPPARVLLEVLRDQRLHRGEVEGDVALRVGRELDRIQELLPAGLQEQRIVDGVSQCVVGLIQLSELLGEELA